MSPYQLNKFVSLSIPLGVLLVGVLFSNLQSPVLWWTLLIMAHTLGYTHFILGYVYQYKSLKKKQNKKLLYSFYILTVCAILFSSAFIVFGLLPFLAVIAIGYFIVHGVLNELTQMKDLLGRAPQAGYMLSLVFYILTFFLVSLAHPSFFFTPTLEFINPSPEVAARLLNSILSLEILRVVTVLSIALFLLMLPVRLFFAGKYLSGFLILLVSTSTLYMFTVVQPLNYIVLYFLALTYHFISWGLYYWQKLKMYAPEKIPKYIYEHLLVLVPLMLASLLLYFPSPIIHTSHSIVFSILVFITLTMVHNTTSFINETWFVSFINKYV